MAAWDVAIVGAGFAGLTAAVELAGRGARVLVLEARPQLGGRATAFLDRVTGELVDNGQHVLFGCYRDTFRFLETIGASGRVRVQPGLDVLFVDPRGRRSRLRCPPLPSPLHLMAGVLEWEGVSFRDRLSVLGLRRTLRMARRWARGDARARPASPNETVDTWLALNGQSRALRQMLWEPLALAALNQSPAQAAALPFVRVLAEMFGPDPRDASIAVPVVPLHLMYAEPAREYIEAHGGEVRTGAPASVRFAAGAGADGRVAGVEAKGQFMPAGAVVCAVPWFALGSVFPHASEPPPALQPLLTGAAGMASQPIVTVNLWFDRPWLEEAFVGLPGRTMQWVFNKADPRFGFGETATHLSLVSSGAESSLALSNDELTRIALEEVMAALPEARAARLVRSVVVREKRATFSLAPGQPPRPGPATGVSGLVLAGDWIDTGLPGTIESAVLSGRLAAGSI
jgi:hydroxysqualene dehydroxylase